MFHSALLKLTLLYVLIVMIISISFSVVLFNVSSKELGRGLGNQTKYLRNMPPAGNHIFDELEKIRDEQIDESAQNLKTNLIYFNLIIFISSLFASYFLAKITLRPIEESIQAQDRFTADASHELRTPLTAMKSEIEVNLRENHLTIAEAKKLLYSNLEEINKLEYLSNALLKLSKKSIFINGKFKKVKIQGDTGSLTELFVILLDNAVKYSPKGSKINISINHNHKEIEVVVADHGLGIKASDLPHIFERFYRADISRSKEKVDGYGLGLSIAKQIANLHGAKISVESKPGKGSQFKVIF